MGRILMNDNRNLLNEVTTDTRIEGRWADICMP